MIFILFTVYLVGFDNKEELVDFGSGSDIESNDDPIAGSDFISDIPGRDLEDDQGPAVASAPLKQDEENDKEYIETDNKPVDFNSLLESFTLPMDLSIPAPNINEFIK